MLRTENYPNAYKETYVILNNIYEVFQTFLKSNNIKVIPQTLIKV